jgi:hypothetical protein
MKTTKFVRIATFVSALVITASSARAAFTDDFDILRGEILSRSLALSNSVDKTEISQKKTCDKAIALIDKASTSLATDIKTANKVASLMIKAFPNEFLLTSTPSLVFSNSIVDVLLTAYTALGTDVQAEIITLGGLIASLPDGSDKIKATAQFDAATDSLALAQTSLTFAQGGKLIGQSLKAALKGQKIAIKAGGGGGTCGAIAQSSVTMTASNDAFSASAFAGAEYTQSTKTFSVGGTDGVTGNSVAFTVDSGVTGPGTYTTNISGNYTIGSPPTKTYNISGGSMTINGLDLVGSTACGTGSFTASDGVNVIVVTDFIFAIKSLAVSP